MIIWTIQPYQVYQEIMDKGTFFCNSDLSPNLKDDMDFSRAYHWMIQQMIKKIGPSSKTNAYPFGLGIGVTIIRINVRILGGLEIIRMKSAWN